MPKEERQPSLDEMGISQTAADFSEAQQQLRMVEFKNRIALADGELIPLRRLSPYEEPLYVTARYFPFGKFKYKSLLSSSTDKQLVMDIYAHNHSMDPIAHFDWRILGDLATQKWGNHSYIEPISDHEKLADTKWGEITVKAVQTIEKYQRNGIGSFMLASSLVVLEKLGVINVSVIHILGPARPLWSNFGITEPIARDVPLQSLIANPYTDKSIEAFV